MTKKLPVAIVGSGNIGTDLMFKLLRSEVLEPVAMIGVDPNSKGLALAAEKGLDATAEGVDWIFRQNELPSVIFEATSAYVHVANAPRYEEAGIRAVDLTPAAVGPFVVPAVNLREHLGGPNLNMVTCGGQATIPIVYAVARCYPVEYAEIIATVASQSAGLGTRQNIDEFTGTTSRAVVEVGGAERGKAISILNPARPALVMRDTIFCSLPDDIDRDVVAESITTMVAEVAKYVPGYRFRTEPQFDTMLDGSIRVAVFIEVEGAGDFLPAYAGNLDIMTAAAVRVGELIVGGTDKDGIHALL
jgi:acetaldehyde dehydrogenase